MQPERDLIATVAGLLGGGLLLLGSDPAKGRQMLRLASTYWPALVRLVSAGGPAAGPAADLLAMLDTTDRIVALGEVDGEVLAETFGPVRAQLLALCATLSVAEVSA